MNTWREIEGSDFNIHELKTILRRVCASYSTVPKEVVDPSRGLQVIVTEEVYAWGQKILYDFQLVTSFKELIDLVGTEQLISPLIAGIGIIYADLHFYVATFRNTLSERSYLIYVSCQSTVYDRILYLEADFIDLDAMIEVLALYYHKLP